MNIHKIWDKEVEKGEINDAIKHIDKRIIVFIDDFSGSGKSFIDELKKYDIDCDFYPIITFLNQNSKRRYFKD